MQINPSHEQQPDLINTSAYVQYAPSQLLGGGYAVITIKPTLSVKG